MRVTHVAAGLIFDDQGQILIAQRAEPDFLKELWEFPGGKIEDGESPETTLHREIQEELELKIKIEFLIGEFVDTYKGRTVRIQAFKAKALNTNFQVRDHLDVRWVNPADLAKFDLVPADKPIYPALISLNISLKK